MPQTTFKEAGGTFILNSALRKISSKIVIFFINVLLLILKMNQRFYNSLINDPDLMLTVSLANVLIFNDDSLTPWTNTTLCGIPGVYKYKTNPPTISAPCSVKEFANAINNLHLNFSFDYATAVMK